MFLFSQVVWQCQSCNQECFPVRDESWSAVTVVMVIRLLGLISLFPLQIELFEFDCRCCFVLGLIILVFCLSCRCLCGHRKKVHEEK
jgi:hypothetical protein